MSNRLMSRMQAPQNAVRSDRRAAPHDVQSRAKALMNQLMKKRDLDAAEFWMEDANAWLLPFSRAPIVVRLVRVETPADDENAPPDVQDLLLIHVRVMRLPTGNLLALYRHVLEVNSFLHGISFAIEGEHLLIRSQRSLHDLDESELDDAIGHTVGAVNHFGPQLCHQFDTGAVPD